MDDENNMEEQMEELLRNMPNRLKVMEDGIDAETMAEFQALLKSLETEEEVGEAALPSIQVLSDLQQHSPQALRRELLRIADQGTVEAYRLLEQFVPTLSENKLLLWARMSLLHCRMHLENELSDEPVGFIATGLGGKGDKIRYYFAVRSKEGELSEGQQRWVVQAFEESADKADAELESKEIFPLYLGFYVLLHWKSSILDFIGQAMEQCEDFIDSTFWITNVAKPSEEELKTWIIMGAEGGY